MTQRTQNPRRRLSRRRHDRSLSTINVMQPNEEYAEKGRDFTQADKSSHRETAELQKRLVAHNKSVNRVTKTSCFQITPETRELFRHIPPRKTRS